MCIKDIGQYLPIIGTAEMANVAVLISLELTRFQHLDSRDNYLNTSQLELIGKETGSRLIKRGRRQKCLLGGGDNQSSSHCQGS